MANWICESKTLHHGGKLFNGRTGANGEYGIQVELQTVGMTTCKAAFEVDFRLDWNKATIPSTYLSCGDYFSYTDPEGVDWRVYVDSTHIDPEHAFSTADMRVCYDEPASPPAHGEIVSIDIPAEASEGDSIDLCATIKNTGGTAAMFFLRFYDGATMVRETLPSNVAAGATTADICESFIMPDHAWTGKIELMRQT